MKKVRALELSLYPDGYATVIRNRMDKELRREFKRKLKKPRKSDRV